MRLTLRLVLLFCVFLSYGLANQCLAQSSIGVKWNIPDDQNRALSELETFQGLDISTIEIDKLPGSRTWSALDSLGFEVYAQVPISFPLVSTFSDPDSVLINQINEYIREYSSRSSVGAIGLFRFGAVHKAAFDTTILPFIKQIRNRFNGRLYYTSAEINAVPADDHFDFKIVESRVEGEVGFESVLTDSISSSVTAYLYTPVNGLREYLNPFKDFLAEASENNATVFVHSDWLFDMTDKYPEFAGTVELYNSEAEFIFPVPKEDIVYSANHSLIVLLLILIWGLFAVNYHLSPVYRKSLARYFGSHVFFVEDVMNRHIRSMGPSVIVLIQNMLLAGICIYTLGNVLLSPLGYDALFYHYPFLLLFGNPSLSLFLAGCFFALILTIISIIWLRISNKSVTQTRQVLNLYAMPLQLNFLIVTAMTALVTTGNRPGLLVLLGLLFALIHISAFITAALDTSRFLNKQKYLFYVISIGLYSVIWIGSGIWLLSGKFFQIIQLALSLS